MVTAVAIDTETHVIRPTDYRPPLVSVAIAPVGLLLSAKHHRKAILEQVTDLLEDPDIRLVGHHIAYDLEVLRRYGVPTGSILDAYEAGRIWCTRVAAQLVDIALGDRSSYSLDALSGVKDEDPEGWQTRFEELEDLPIDQWPEAARRYAQQDATAALSLYERQQRQCQQDLPAHLGTQQGRFYVLRAAEVARQSRYDYVLNVMRCDGIGVDLDRVRQLAADATAEIHQADTELHRAGILKVNPRSRIGYSKDTKAIKARVEAAMGDETPRTLKGNVETSQAVLLATGDPLLRTLAERSKVEKRLGFLNTLEEVSEAGARMHPRWNVLVNSGRTSCGSKEHPGNLQNQPRGGGIRECFVPAHGNVFVAVDYATAELRSLAQIQLDWFGHSAMADALRDGADLHQELADSLGWLDRQGAKAVNFGVPGGLGAAALADYARDSYGVDLSDEQASEAVQAYFKRWPEMDLYFNVIQSIPEGGAAVQHRVGRVRGGLRYTSAANTMFQGLTADGAKEALWQVQRFCMAEGVGCRPVAFVHDEIIVEGPEETASEWTATIMDLMVSAMQIFTPNIPVKVEAKRMLRWSK